jgi:hypothetical protein
MYHNNSTDYRYLWGGSFLRPEMRKPPISGEKCLGAFSSAGAAWVGLASEVLQCGGVPAESICVITDALGVTQQRACVRVERQNLAILLLGDVTPAGVVRFEVLLDRVRVPIEGFGQGLRRGVVQGHGASNLPMN